MTLRRTISATIIAIVVVAGCGGAWTSGSPAPSGPPGPTPSGGASPAPSPSADSAAPSPSAVATLVLKVATEGGFINPSANLAALPVVAVYADGRIMTPGPTDAIYPGALLPPVAVRDVGPVGAAAIVTAVKDAGLDKAAAAGPGIPGDSGTDLFTVVIDGVTTTSRYAGGGQPGNPGGPVASGDAARAAAFALLDRLLDPAETWGAPAAQASTYAPTAFRIFVAPGAPSAEPTVSQSPAAWPLATPLAGFGIPAVPDRGIAGLRQGAVLGADAALLAPVLERATTLTAFTSGGAAYTLYVRPLLPDEIGG
jgi:hypothetical protein